MLERVLKAISRYNMLGDTLNDMDNPGGRVIAAVSGGADSVCLVHVLRELIGQDGSGARLVGIAHFNHKLRGEASDEDERFVEALAAELGLPFYRDEARVAGGAGDSALAGGAGDSACHLDASGNLEQNARRARREFFSRLIQQGAGDRIALGHTRDDQAETVLFRLLRGSGLAGLAGIHPVTTSHHRDQATTRDRVSTRGGIPPLVLIRPLIDVTRREVEEYLRGRGVAWREDQSNRDLKFARNRIRHHLLPQLAREWNPRIGEALAQLADLAFEEESWWSANLQNASAGETADDKIVCPTNACPTPTSATEFRVDWLNGLPRAVARRVIRRAIAKAKGDLRGIEFGHVESILNGLGAGLTQPRGGVPGVGVLVSFGFLRIAPLTSSRVSIDPVTVNIPGTYATSEGEIRLEIARPGSIPRPGIHEPAESACANLKAELASPIILRGWRPGDHYRPVGKSRDQKLKEMFQSARIPSWRRRTWPILESGGKILWAREFGAAEEFSANGRRGPVLRVWDLRNGSESDRVTVE